MQQIYKKLLLLGSFLLLLLISLHAQTVTRELAMQWVQGAADELNLSETDRANLMVSDAYTDAGTGISYVYIQQRYNGIKVYNAVNSLAFRNGKLLSQTNRFAPKIEVNAVNAVASLTPQQAVNLAALAIQANVPVSLTVQQDNLLTANTIIFSTGGIARREITVEKYWVKRDNSDVLDLAWNVNIDKLGSSDWWNVRIGAHDGTVLDKDNWTVTCNWDKPGTAPCKGHDHLPAPAPQGKDLLLPPSPPTVTSASYTVLPYPIESPIHGSHAVENNPWLKAGAGSTATTNGWHYDGTVNYNITRGNNVFAALDTAASNTAQGSDTSSTAAPALTFAVAPDLAQGPKISGNRRAALTNLFYWNNIVHDLTYKYGFTEGAGNFQADNLSRGGLGNDFVRADAQDGTGLNNANFGTPVDGTSGRMQMFLFNYTTPNRDGDFDNGVIVHEYGHGISNRFTGGPANSSCLNNAEQAGEGWSDYLGLMLTTDWSTAVMADSIKSRPMGTYVIGQPVTGAGIRRNPYNYNKTINPITYANMAASGESHNIGEIWCSALWDMTWNLCAMQGISPNLFDTSATGGNIVALRLVMEGMRLQPCSPGFLDSRNAILKADSILYGYAHRCQIYKAFARRGMGVNAVQGSSNSTSDQVANFDTLKPISVTKIASQPSVTQNGAVTFTLKTECFCGAPVANYSVSDSLAAGLQYVSSSGGTLTGGNVVTFGGINFTANGQSVTHTVVANVTEPGCNPDSLIKDNRETMLAGGLASSSGSASPQWGNSATRSKSAPTSWFVKDTSVVRDTYLTSDQLLVGSKAELSFWHYHSIESGFDGGVVEISTNNGGNWADLGPSFTSNGYTGTISTSYGSPIGGRSAFTGSSGGVFKQSKADLASYAGQTIRIRFRMATDNSTSGEGWYIDDIVLQSGGCGVTNKAILRNGLLQRVDSGIVYVASKPIVVVPLTLLSFAVSKVNGGVGLNWVTTNEMNTDRFEIYKSTDGLQWQLLGTVAAAGNTSLERQYTAQDSKPAEGLNYYRIKMIDRDGRFTFSAVRTVKYDGGKLLLSVQPNPADHAVTVSLNTANSKGTIWLNDAAGRRIWSMQLSGTQGSVYTIPTATLHAGVYGVGFENGDGKQVVKLVVKH